MNMYRQAIAAPCNLRLAGNYLRENGPIPPPLPPCPERIFDCARVEMPPLDCTSRSAGPGWIGAHRRAGSMRAIVDVPLDI